MKPQTVHDVKDKTIRISTFDVDKITALPALLKHYTGLIEAVQKMGGEVITSYGSTVEIVIPKNAKQLKETLESEQRAWQNHSDLYDKVRDGEAIKSYQEYGVKEWAEAEKMPEPVFFKEVEEDAEVS